MQGIAVGLVSAWLERNVTDATGPFRFTPIAGGRSNLTFAVIGADGARFVLRRPPLGRVLATAHDMAREYRIISAIGRTGVPVAPALALCTDAEINQAPFYVMGFVDGEVLGAPDTAELLGIPQRRLASEHLIDVLADLHGLDVDEIGLGDLARRDGYVERQLRRWTAQWENSKTRELPEVTEVAERLSRSVPRQQGVVVAHGDYRFGNCLTDCSLGRINAVLDWELCTLGDPLADLGYLGVYWTDPGSSTRRQNDPSGVTGFPTYAELLDRYAERTGRDLSEISYYVAFSSWRLAVISEGVYARYLHGAMGAEADPAVFDTFRVAAEDLARAALETLIG